MFNPEMTDVKEKEIQIEKHEKALDKMENSNIYNGYFTFDDIYFSREKRLEITVNRPQNSINIRAGLRQ